MDTFYLTRYLYSAVEVRQSLLFAILDGQLDEALFWAFELYYTDDFVGGEVIDESAFRYVVEIYHTIFQKHNAGIEKWIQTKLHTVDKAVALGSLVQTLIGRQYSVCDFITTYLHIKCIDKASSDPPLKKLCILLRKEDITKYETVCNDDPRKILKDGCRYAVRQNANAIFQTFVPDNMLELWRNGWLYYAARSPVWLHRIEEFEGAVNDETKTVDFDDEDYDEDDTTLSERFYLKWNYDPDEQGVEIRDRIIGKSSDDTVQMTVQSFCCKYGAIIPTRKLKIRS
jgi:hypothetical protein